MTEWYTIHLYVCPPIQADIEQGSKLTPAACLWIVGGSWPTWREPTQTQGERAGPSTCEATVVLKAQRHYPTTCIHIMHTYNKNSILKLLSVFQKLLYKYISLYI